MNELDKLKDIKPLVEISDYSLFILIFTIILALVTLTAGIYFLLKYLKEKKARDNRKFYYKKLKKMSMLDSKHCAYTISKYGKFLIEDDEQGKFLEILNENLEVYKYTNIPQSLSEENKKMIKEFMEMIDV